MKATAVILLALLLISSAVITGERISERSVESKVITSRDLNYIKQQLTIHFSLGWRVVAIECQGNGNAVYKAVNQKDELIVVLEK